MSEPSQLHAAADAVSSYFISIDRLDLARTGDCIGIGKAVIDNVAPLIVAATRAKVAEEIEAEIRADECAKAAAEIRRRAAFVGFSEKANQGALWAASIVRMRHLPVTICGFTATPAVSGPETPAKHFVRLAHRNPGDGRPGTIRAECICRWHGAWVRFRHTAQRHGDEHHAMWADAIPTDHIGES